MYAQQQAGNVTLKLNNYYLDTISMNASKCPRASISQDYWGIIKEDWGTEVPQWGPEV